jgi:hypothetical protein
MFILTEHPFVFNYCFKKYKNLPVHLSWEAMQRLAASGSYIVVSDYRLENCGALRAALRPYFNRLSDDFP